MSVTSGTVHVRPGTVHVRPAPNASLCAVSQTSTSITHTHTHWKISMCIYISQWLVLYTHTYAHQHTCTHTHTHTHAKLYDTCTDTCDTYHTQNMTHTTHNLTAHNPHHTHTHRSCKIWAETLQLSVQLVQWEMIVSDHVDTHTHACDCWCMWLASIPRFSPQRWVRYALLLQVTNAGVRRPGYEAKLYVHVAAKMLHVGAWSELCLTLMGVTYD